jgi:hypothetical protein
MRVGCICYACEQGLGYLMKWFHEAGVITDVVVYRHPRRPTMDWHPGAPVIGKPFLAHQEVKDLIDRIDALLCFETPIDWDLLPYCKERGVKTVLIPMYEWHLERPPHQFDRYINPSLLDQRYFPQGTFIPIPAKVEWRQRTKALTYLHNAGHVGSRNHKGTVEVLKAMRHVKTPLSLTVRCQDVGLIPRLKSEARFTEDSRVSFEGPVPYDRLFAEHDVYVAPEKYNGLSLPLQEAFASGMLVMTTDRFPANTWLPLGPMIPVQRYDRVRVQPSNLEIEEAVVDPVRIADTMDAWYGQDISALSAKGKEWAEENSWEKLKPRYLEAIK